MMNFVFFICAFFSLIILVIKECNRRQYQIVYSELTKEATPAKIRGRPIENCPRSRKNYYGGGGVCVCVQRTIFEIYIAI